MPPEIKAYTKKISIEPKTTEYIDIEIDEYIHFYIVNDDFYYDIDVQELQSIPFNNQIKITNHNTDVFLIVILFIRKKGQING